MRDVVVEAGDPDVAVVITHAGDEVREHCARIGRPVAVVPAVQSSCGTINGELHARRATYTKEQLLPAALMLGPVAQQKHVTRQQLAIALQDREQMRGAGFLLALEKKFDVYRWLAPARM